MIGETYANTLNVRCAAVPRLGRAPTTDRRTAIYNNPTFDFLKDIVKNVEDFKDADAERAPQAKKRKVQRSKDGASTSSVAKAERPAAVVAVGSRRGTRQRKPSSKSIEAAENADFDEDVFDDGRGNVDDDEGEVYDPTRDREAQPRSEARPAAEAAVPAVAAVAAVAPPAPAQAAAPVVGVGMGHEDEDEDYD